MILDFIIDKFTNLLIFFITLLPNFSIPTTLDTSLIWFSTAVGNLAYFNNYLPIQFIAQCVLLVSSASIFYVSVKIFRIVASYFTGGGGNAI
jgi:hypothetical protein